MKDSLHITGVTDVHCVRERRNRRSRLPLPGLKIIWHHSICVRRHHNLTKRKTDFFRPQRRSRISDIPGGNNKRRIFTVVSASKADLP